MDNGHDGATVAPVETMFFTEGDNVYFRGLDIGEEWEGYECPLFGSWVSEMVARYISTENAKIRYDGATGAYTIKKKGDSNIYVLRAYRYANDVYYDFGGTARWRKESRGGRK